ncbi:MAG: enoyl-[acyl-carrier-protein] reductase FabK, partial [Clostridiales bacterium]|nr:enoyl-[acyl-carrier-protein] reductase FabK [Clostridiales bacterium]
LKTPFSRDYAKAEYDSSISNEALEAMGTGALRLAVQEGDTQRGSFLAGQISGMIHKEQSAAEIVQELCTEAETVLKGATKWVK